MPSYDGRAPTNGPKRRDLESVVADQVQRRGHERAATGQRVQSKSHLSDTVPLKVKDDAAAEASFSTSLRLNRPAQSLTVGPAGGSQRQKALASRS
jgi:hypothetical protein